MTTINKKEFIKTLKDEMAEAVANTGGKKSFKKVTEYDIEDMTPDHAFNYGYYRACEALLEKYK
jgi:hypothetical protein